MTENLTDKHEEKVESGSPEAKNSNTRSSPLEETSMLASFCNEC